MLIKLQGLKKLFGYKYLYNENTKEVHDWTKGLSSCSIGLMSKSHKKFLTRNGVNKVIENEGANGCRWCMPQIDTD